MRDLRECQSHDADSSVRSSGRLQALLRQDDTNGRFAEAFTFEMRDMQGKDSTFETNPHPTGLLDVREVVGSAAKRLGVQHGDGSARWSDWTRWKMGRWKRPSIRLPLLHGERFVLYFRSVFRFFLEFVLRE